MKSLHITEKQWEPIYKQLSTSGILTYRKYRDTTSGGVAGHYSFNMTIPAEIPSALPTLSTVEYSTENNLACLCHHAVDPTTVEITNIYKEYYAIDNITAIKNKIRQLTKADDGDYTIEDDDTTLNNILSSMHTVQQIIPSLLQNVDENILCALNPFLGEKDIEKLFTIRNLGTSVRHILPLITTTVTVINYLFGDILHSDIDTNGLSPEASRVYEDFHVICNRLIRFHDINEARAKLKNQKMNKKAK